MLTNLFRSAATFAAEASDPLARHLSEEGDRTIIAVSTIAAVVVALVVVVILWMRSVIMRQIEESTRREARLETRLESREATIEQNQSRIVTMHGQMVEALTDNTRAMRDIHDVVANMKNTNERLLTQVATLPCTEVVKRLGEDGDA